MIDTNIILDVLLQRDPFFESSKQVLKLCEDKQVQGFLSASSVTDIFYILRKKLQNTDATYKAFGAILEIVKILTVTNSDVLNAYMQKANDFEDCLLATCAKSNKCNAIVTRNKKDFQNFGMELLSPEELLEKYDYNKHL